MFKHIKRLLTIAAASALCLSCDLLNTPPEGSVPPDGFYNTPARVEQGVLGVYSLLRDVEGAQYLTLSEYRSDNMWADPAPNGIRNCSEINFFRFDSNLKELKTAWHNWYLVITNANFMLDQIADVEFEDESVKDQFTGELLFLRGLAHFELTRIFGDVPVIDRQVSVEESKTIRQTPAGDVINDRVIVDLKQAENLLPYEKGIKDAGGKKIGGSGRADKVVAQAMLARVYMTLKGFPYNDATAKEPARSYLEAVLKYSRDNGDKYWAPTIVEWQKQWLTEPDVSNKYQIFSIQHRLSYGNPIASQEGWLLTGEYLPNGGGGNSTFPIFIEASLWYEYSSNNDKRGLGHGFLDGFKAYGNVKEYANIPIDITLEDGRTVEAYELSINTKFCPFLQKRQALGVTFDDSSLGGWPLNFPVIRLEDMQLLYAELLVEDGRVGDALGYVNAIRRRAGVPEVSTSVSPEEAMKYIKRERKLELFLEGVRWFDQIRYGEWKENTLDKFDRYKVNGEYRRGVSPDNVLDGRYLSPIPRAEMDAVPGLYVQNDDWN